MLSADFRLPRVAGHAINVVLCILLWLGVAALAAGAADAITQMLHHR